MFLAKKRPQAQFIETLRAYSKKLSSILDLKDLLRNQLHSLAEIAGAKSGVILLFEKTRKAFVVRESLGGDPLVLQFPSQNPFINFLANIGEPVTKRQLLEDRRLIDVKESGLEFHTALHAEAVFPMHAENKFIGIFSFGPRSDGKAYPEEILDFLCILVSLGGISIDNAILYESIIKQNMKLSEIAHLKTDFVNNVTHELRTPLNGILGLTQVLMEPDLTENLNDDQRRYIRMIQSAGEELLETVNHILELTQLQSKSSSLEVKRVDLHQAMQGLSEEIQGQFPGHRIRVHNILDEHATVYGDEAQIRQVFQSLLENAAKFSREGVSNTIEIRATRSGDMLKICISDQGIGIEEKNQELVFEDFRQAEGNLSRSFGGTGLGLALAKKIVELHGGRIWVESKKGEGAQFFFTLPLKPALVCATEIDTHRV